MRVAIDARAYQWTGIGRYIRHLLDGLVIAQPQIEITVIMNRGDAAVYTGPFHVHVVDSSYYSWREQFLLPLQLRYVSADLWHFTHFNMPTWWSKPYVVTIHDTTRFVFPGQKQQSWHQQVAYEWLFSRTVQRAAGIITVSEATQRAVQALPVSSLPSLRVLYEGVDERFFAPVPSLARTKIRMLLGVSDPYLLYVGVWMSHKNLVRLLQAFSLVQRRYPWLKLVITGKPVPGYVDLLRAAEAAGVADSVLFPGFVPDDLLPALYSESLCFVFPSLYEGFGLPPLEAAACGIPVVSSNVSSMPEVLQDGAWYMNPESVADMANSIEAVVQNGALRRRLSHAGRQRAAMFSWAHMVEEHIAFYRSLAERV